MKKNTRLHVQHTITLALAVEVVALHRAARLWPKRVDTTPIQKLATHDVMDVVANNMVSSSVPAYNSKCE